ncbi:MAG: class I SAM-dependent methyltransferase [Rickettsiales bacterium]|jgi:2-polyprenyl-3-methyl-5-hydroxy-6-metoxy-1,4-benzoquinol methylase|nr:class I SAM-dependent methyltransferase [Rickettsiales bacterium]
MINWDKTYTENSKLPWGQTPELLIKEKNFLQPYLNSPYKKTILDYGFGTGHLMDHMKTCGHKVYGAEQ